MIKAYRGEFGLKVRFHVPVIYAMGPGHVIEIERGEEALYPLAKEWLIVDRATDDSRHGSPQTRYGRRKEARFVPQPHVLQLTGRPDVVICPRKRNYGASKNWEHWKTLVYELQERHGVRVFAAGSADASFTDLGCECAWDYPRELDASIEAMNRGRLVVAACSGLAHLAVLCGAPMLMFTYRGMVAPGPVISSRGRFVSKNYWPVRFQEYYQAANHRNAPIELLDGWEYPDHVLTRTLQLLR